MSDSGIFNEHLFSRNLFGGHDAIVGPGVAARPTAVYFLYRVVGDGIGTSELQFLEECRLLSDGDEPYSQAGIQERYGAGTYRVMMTAAGGPPIEMRRFMITPPSGDVPVDLPEDIEDMMPLDVLEQMLLSAADTRHPDAPSLTSRLGRSIAGGWTTTVRLLDDEGLSHPWRHFMPMFQDYSDSEIYRAYVARGHIRDTASLREHILDAISMIRVVCERYSLKNWDTMKEHQGKWYLWLDDERDPKVVLAPDNGEEALGSRYRQYVNAGLVDVEWRWAKSNAEAIALVEEYGYPKAMGLDHDLGDLRYQGSTSMTFIHWLADGGYHVPAWYVHSANPIGAENIRSFMRSWGKSVMPIVTNENNESEALTPQQARDLTAMLRLDEVLDDEDAEPDSVDDEADDQNFFDDEAAEHERARGEE